jgi:rRNA maturation protein Nop10
VAETHLDHPGEVTWFAGYGPAQPTGACEHACPHDGAGVIGWGPDFEHYSLVRCPDCGCRAWTVEYPPPFSDDRPKYRVREFLAVAS